MIVFLVFFFFLLILYELKVSINLNVLKKKKNVGMLGLSSLSRQCKNVIVDFKLK